MRSWPCCWLWSNCTLYLWIFGILSRQCFSSCHITSWAWVAVASARRCAVDYTCVWECERSLYEITDQNNGRTVDRIFQWRKCTDGLSGKIFVSETIFWYVVFLLVFWEFLMWLWDVCRWILWFTKRFEYKPICKICNPFNGGFVHEFMHGVRCD